MQTKAMRSLLTLSPLICGVLIFSGCGQSGSVPTVDIEGFVTLNGEPFTGAAVHFYNPERGGGAFNLDPDGKFSSPTPIPVGEYMVALDRPGPIDGDTPAEIVWPENKVNQVPKQYLSAVKSGFVARVSEDGENHFFFEMKGVPKKSSKQGPQPTPFQPLTMN